VYGHHAPPIFAQLDGERGRRCRSVQAVHNQRGLAIIAGMSGLDAAIDRLYQGPLDGFVAARTVLAKTVKGADAQRVKQLPKPTIVPWAVNQVYWHARPTFDRLLKAGRALRAAQLAALQGTASDTRAAAAAHRAAVTDAASEASRLASSHGLQPGLDEVSRTLEVLSLAEPSGFDGRLCKPLQPAGFEALVGVHVKAASSRATEPAADPERARAATRESRQKEEERLARERARAAAERRRRAAIEKAREAVARAEAGEARARAEWEEQKRALKAAQQVLAQLEMAMEELGSED
jgi:hypothetical protein